MISIIVAVARNGVIGDRNALLWHISEDMRHFRRVTSGHPVIMGRKTYESIGRPLPNRTNVVVTRGTADFEGCRRAGSLAEAVAMFPAGEEIFIIGGAQIYREALTVADRVYLTVVERDDEGDTAFPEWEGDAWQHCARDGGRWVLMSSERHERGEDFDHPFRFEIYELKKA